MLGLVFPQINITAKTRYGEYSITVRAAEPWNKFQKQLKNMLLKDLSRNKVKTVVTNFYFKSH